MRKSRVAIAVVLIVILAVGMLMLARMRGWSPTGMTTLLPRDGAAAQPASHAGAGADKATVQTPPPAAQLDIDHLRRVLDNLNPGQRRKVLDDQKLFHSLVTQEARNASLLAAAQANHVPEAANVRFLAQRAADNVVRELYMKQLLRNKIPTDFPTAEQIKQYYDAHPDKFKVGERIQVWQVFLPENDQLTGQQKKALEDKAAGIVKDIKGGKISFAEAAYRYSGHEQSRVNGGYMGLVPVSELRPGIARALHAVEQGKVSQPVQTPEGLHILMKGNRVPGRELGLDEASEQIRRYLLRSAVEQLRQAVYAQAEKSYPVDLQDNKIEQWRLGLRTDTVK